MTLIEFYMEIGWLHEDTHSEYNIVYLRNMKDILEETKPTGKNNYLRKVTEEKLDPS
jgi:hypothetical protein